MLPITREKESVVPAGHAFKISRLDSTRSIRGRMPSSLDMARDSSSRYMVSARYVSPSRWSKQSELLNFRSRLLESASLPAAARWP